ncbi:glycosyl hydrolase family 18 protein [Spartinivicinus ruber]|uniref:glycosyl hydrolase family 18 protein n=1 Tax=Spartinivicinus ruber TaxID=2683272 RepID=UPI0013D521DF|nr:glycosyl hydrolase family 18 protein [Spartinivicinus ruber]
MSSDLTVKSQIYAKNKKSSFSYPILTGIASFLLISQASLANTVEITQTESGNIPDQTMSVPWDFKVSKYTGKRDHFKLFYDWLWDEQDPFKEYAGFRPGDYHIYLAERTGLDWENKIQYKKIRLVKPEDRNWTATKEHHQPFNVTDSGKIVGLYMGEWGVWERAYTADYIAANNITHLFYSFVGICDYERPNATENNGLDIQFGKNSRNKAVMRASCGQGLAPDQHDNLKGDLVKIGVTKKQRDFEISPYDYLAFPHLLESIKAMKAQFPHLKGMLSVGGWTLSDPFYDLVKTPERHQVFIQSIIDTVKTNPGVFDGIDLDWEFPGGSGLSPDLTAGYIEDSDNFTLFVKALRKALTAEFGEQFELTAALSASPAKLAAVDLNTLKDDFNFINLMTYDLYGAWGKDPSHHAGVYAKPVAGAYNVTGNATDELGNIILHNGQPVPLTKVMHNYSVEGAVKTIQQLYPEFPMAKLTIGAASYSRGWQYIKTQANHAKLFWHGKAQQWSNSNGSGLGNKGTFEFGVSDFRDIYDHYMKEDTQYLYYDRQAESAYIWQPHSNLNNENYHYAHVEAFDSPRSVIAKGELIKKYGLGGIFAWEAQTDNGLILNAMNAAVCNPLKDGNYYQFSQPYAGTVTSEVIATDNKGNPTKVRETLHSAETYQFDGKAFCDSTTPGNRPPQVTITGPNKVKANTMVVLDASQSTDPDGDQLSFEWKIPNGINVDNTQVSKIRFTTPAVQQDTIFKFGLSVSDGQANVQRLWSLTVTSNDPGNSCNKDPDAKNYPAWQADKTYQSGAKVSHNYLVWQSNWWNSHNEPGTNEAWKLLSNIILAWQASKAYPAGSIIHHQGTRYKAKWWTKGEEPGKASVWQPLGKHQCLLTLAQ